MLFGEFLEMLVDDFVGVHVALGASETFELEQQTVAQVGGGYARRVEVADDLQHVGHFLVADVQTRLKGDVGRH
jgi:hypothetical protein